MRNAVIDTCVLVDLLMATRKRHDKARKLRKELLRLDVIARVPAFAIFEISHAMRQEQRLSQGKLVSSDTGGAEGLSIEFVPVDDDFVRKYFNFDLPEVRAGDLVFAALAMGEALPLITEDNDFAQKAKLAGIEVFSIDEYQNELSKIAV